MCYIHGPNYPLALPWCYCLWSGCTDIQYLFRWVIWAGHVVRLLSLLIFLIHPCLLSIHPDTSPPALHRVTYMASVSFVQFASPSSSQDCIVPPMLNIVFIVGYRLFLSRSIYSLTCGTWLWVECFLSECLLAFYLLCLLFFFYFYFRPLPMIESTVYPEFCPIEVVDVNPVANEFLINLTHSADSSSSRAVS